MLPSQLTSIYSRNFSCGTGLRALTACLRIPDWPRRLVSNFAHITAGLGGPKMQLAHLIGSHQWEMPSCTGFSGFAWGLITSQLRRAAISTCLGPVVSATCAILMHGSLQTCDAAKWGRGHGKALCAVQGTRSRLTAEGILWQPPHL